MKLEVKNLCVTLSGKKILDNINFTLEPKVYSLIGANGAGKSTLLKALTRTLNYSGSVIYNGSDLKTNSLKENAKIISLMSQFQAQPSLTVADVLSLGRRPFSSFKLTSQDKKIIDEIVTQFCLQKFLQYPMDTLSGGERQKVYLAKALIQKPKILLLDEPISHLDPKNQIEILNIVKKVTHSQNLITLIVIHDLHNALHFSDEVLMLKNGKLLYKEITQNVDEKMLNETFDIECKIFKNEGHPFVLLHHKHQHSLTKHFH
jgi:iron complex transport system ATP-binding protein